MRKWVSGIVLAAFYGCNNAPNVNSPIRLSIEQLGAESETRRTEQGLDVRTAVSITGLGLPTVAGQTIMSPGGQLPDLVAVPVAGNCSRLIITKYETDATASDVSGIKTKLDELLDLSVQIAVLQSQQQLGYLGLMQGQQASDAKETDSIQIAAAIGASSATATDISAAQKRITADLDTANAKVQSDLAAVRGFSGKHGILISRWSTSQDATSSASLGNILGFTKKEANTTTGFVVIAGIRDASVQIGTDFITRLAVEHQDSGSAIDVENILDSPYIETFSRSAKFIAYSEQLDATKALASELKITPDQLAAIAGPAVVKNLLLQQQITLSYISSAVVSAANQGMVADSKTEAYPYIFWPRPARAKVLDLERIRRNDGEANSSVGWKDVYSNRATLISLADKFRGMDQSAIDKAKNDSSCWYMVPKDGSYKKIGVYGAGTIFCKPGNDYSKLAWPEWEPDTSQCINMSDNLLK